MLTTATLPQALSKPSIGAVMFYTQPGGGSAKLFALVDMFNSNENLIGTTHSLFSTLMVAPAPVLTVAALATDTVLQVSSTAGIVAGYTFLNVLTNEMVLVLSVPTATSMVVQRGVGSVATAIAVNTSLVEAGSMHEEASIRPAAVWLNATQYSNTSQIIRNTIAVPNTVNAMQMLAGASVYDEHSRQSVWVHSRMIESAMLNGQPSAGIQQSNPIRSMSGMRALLSDPANYPATFNGATNAHVAGATTNWTQLQAMLNSTHDFSDVAGGSSVKTLYCGAGAIDIIDRIIRLNSTYEIEAEATTFGFTVRTLRTSRGKFEILESSQLSGNPATRNHVFILDVATMHLCYMRGRRVMRGTFNSKDGNGNNTQDFGIDARGADILTEFTMLSSNPAANGYIIGLTAAAAG